jgi:C1A family cysteine protease
MVIPRKWGWIPDVGDHRDRPLRIRPKISLPTKVDLRFHATPVEDQGSTSSCVGNAAASVIEQLDNRDGQFTDASRMYIYYNARARQGWEDSDEGCFIRDAIKSMASPAGGVASEVLWPFLQTQVNVKPSPVAYADGTRKTIGDYYRIDGPDRLYQVRYALAAGYPVIFGISVYPSFESEFASRTGIIPMPGPHERLLGGHAIKAVGYDDDMQRVIFQNSWGDSWGDRGFGYLHYDYINDDDLSDDYWVVTKGGFDDGNLKPLTWIQRLFRWIKYLFIP